MMDKCMYICVYVCAACPQREKDRSSQSGDDALACKLCGGHAIGKIEWRRGPQQ